MKEVQDDVCKAILLINKECSGATFSKHCTSYLFGTENQQGIDSILKYKDKDILTVASSGDQYLGAVYYGARNVDIFDINRLSYYITYLKIIAIMNLEYKEFIDFFVPVDWTNIKKSFFNMETFKKLFPFMPTDIEYFWKSIMVHVKEKGYGNFIGPYQYANHIDVVQKGMPFYCYKTEFYKLKNILKSRKLPNFFEVDLLNLKNVIENKYDILYLSNIIECMVRENMITRYGRRGDLEKENELEEEIINKIGSDLVHTIKTNGIVLVSYRPNSNLRYSKDLLYNFEYFKVNNVSSKVSPYDDDYIEQSDVDMVLTYKPSEAGIYFKK